MKKTIGLLVEKLQENPDGTLKGGFSNLKGGLRVVSTNDVCSGDNGTINTGCTNKQDCTKTTNTGQSGCTNSGLCYH